MAELLGRYFLWQGYVLYVGRGGRSALHRHHMVQIGISLGRPIRVRSAAGEAYGSYPGVIVGADQPHQIVASSREPVVFLWIDAEDRAARRLCSMHACGPAPVPLQEDVLTGLRTELADLRLDTGDCGVAREGARTILGALGSEEPAAPFDDRISAVMRMLRAARSGSTPSIEALADAVFLSPSRLMHLFREEVGLPIRRYGLWQRLLLAVRHMAAGTSITEAAHAAAFSDGAHLTRTFRAMFGVTPSELFKNSRFIQAIACYDA